MVWDSGKPLDVEARSANTGVTRHFTIMELFGAQVVTRFAPTYRQLQSEAGNLPPSDGADPNTLPAQLLERADHIIEVVEAVQSQIDQIKHQYQIAAKSFSMADITEQACQSIAAPISRSTYYADRRLWQSVSGDRALIASALRRKTYGKARIGPNEQHFIDTMIRRFYRSNPPLRAQTVYHIAQQLWQHNRHWWVNINRSTGKNFDGLLERLLDGRKGIDDLLADPAQIQDLTQIRLPSRASFYRYAKWFTAQPGEGEEVYVARQGQADWDANFLMFDHFAQTAVLPLQYVFADHYLLDVLHVDDEFREVVGRLWLTVLIDAFSRAVLGIYLAYEAPCIESIQGALRHAIWPKLGLDQYRIDLPWACYGNPPTLIVGQRLGPSQLFIGGSCQGPGGRREIYPNGTCFPPAIPGALWGAGGAAVWKFVWPDSGVAAGSNSSTGSTPLAQRQPSGLPVVSGYRPDCESTGCGLSAYAAPGIGGDDSP